MNCLFCKKDIPENAKYCCYCGRKQERSKSRHSNGSGSVYKRGQTYTAVIRYWDGTKFTSKSKGGFKTKKEAYAAARELSENVKLRRTEAMSFVDLYEKLQQTERYKRLSDDKKKTWKYAFMKCSRLWPVKDFREIRYENLASCIEGLTYYPARDVKVLLNAMYQLADKLELCDKNYAVLLELPQMGEAREKEIFTDEELRRLWECEDPFRDYILIMIYTGLRPVEMRKLRTEDIHLKAGYMMGGQKTELSKKSRIVYPRIIIPLLENFKPWTLGKTQFERRFEEVLDKCGIMRGLTPGCCRHTFITRLTEVEDSAAVIQKAARHTKYQTTLNYTHLPMEDVGEAVNKLFPLQSLK